MESRGGEGHCQSLACDSGLPFVGASSLMTLSTPRACCMRMIIRMQPLSFTAPLARGQEHHQSAYSSRPKRSWFHKYGCLLQNPHLSLRTLHSIRSCCRQCTCCHGMGGKAGAVSIPTTRQQQAFAQLASYLHTAIFL